MPRHPHHKARFLRTRYMLPLGAILGGTLVLLPLSYAQNTAPALPAQESAKPEVATPLPTPSIVTSPPSALPPADLVQEIPVDEGMAPPEDISVINDIERPEGGDISEAEGYFGPLAWTGSMMFNRANLDTLYASMYGVAPSQNVTVGEPDIAAPEITQQNRNLPVTTFAPAYYLQSIMFFAEDNWSLWMNGKKNSVGNPRKDNLIVSTLRNDKVEFIWFDPNLNDMIPGWKEKFEPLEKGKKRLKLTTNTNNGTYSWDYVSPDGDMLVDSTKGAVRFMLQPNQSFRSYDLTVVEGQAEGKSITFTPGQGSKSNAGQSASMGTPVEGAAVDGMPEANTGYPGQEEELNKDGKKDPNALMKRVFNNANK